MKVLVTGGSGLLGQSLQKLVANDSSFIFLSSKDCDLRYSEQVDNLFATHTPDVVIHCASKVAGLYGNMDDNYTMLIDNVKINTHIVESCKKYTVKRLVNILSTCVFPESDIRYPLTSDQILNGRPHPSNSGYAHSKRMLYVGSKLLSTTTEVVNLIPTNLYGEKDNYNIDKSHVIPSLIHKIYLAKQNKTTLTIKGSGTAKRQFVYADDLSKIISYFTTCKLDNKFNCIIVAPDSTNEITIKELVSQLTDLFKFSGNVVFDNTYSDGQSLKTTDSSELLKYTPQFHFTPLQEGLQKTITHFVENYTSIRK